MALPVLTSDFLDVIIRQIRAYCPTLAGRVGGAAEFQYLPESANLAVPAAYVVPMEDDAEHMSQNGCSHMLVDHFGIIAALSNQADERGQTAASAIYGLRRELWRCLLGFQPASYYNGIFYEGRTILQMDRARLWVRYEFGCQSNIVEEDSWQHILQSGVLGDEDLTGYPALETVHVDVDDIDPAAQISVQYPGPDGRIEFQANIDTSGT